MNDLCDSVIHNFLASLRNRALLLFEIIQQNAQCILYVYFVHYFIYAIKRILSERLPGHYQGRQCESPYYMLVLLVIIQYQASYDTMCLISTCLT